MTNNNWEEEFDKKFIDIKDFKYIDSSRPLIGYRFTGYKIIGTFYEDQKNAFEMLDEVKMRVNLPTQSQDK